MNAKEVVLGVIGTILATSIIYLFTQINNNENSIIDLNTKLNFISNGVNHTNNIAEENQKSFVSKTEVKTMVSESESKLRTEFDLKLEKAKLEIEKQLLESKIDSG